MNSSVRALHSRVLAGGAILALAISCTGPSPVTTSATPEAAAAATLAPTVAATAQATTAAASPKAQVVSHLAGATHALQPKRLESVIEIDMYDHYFANVLGQKNPTFTLPVGKTVGIHFHNEGTVLHEFMIGRAPLKDGYEKNLFDLVQSDVFFYYGEAKSEVGGAKFEEMEVEPGLKDVWLRFTVPADLKGEWEIGCFAPEHYEKGMKATVVFQ